jgi:ABC-type transport system involved in multi-copper enzyme maturation permease subunit
VQPSTVGRVLAVLVVVLLALVGIPVALAALAVTIVGIPLSIAGFVTYLLVLWVAFVYGAVVAGTWLLDLGGYESRWGALAVGLGAFALSALALRRAIPRASSIPAPDTVSCC